MVVVEGKTVKTKVLAAGEMTLSADRYSSGERSAREPGWVGEDGIH